LENKLIKTMLIIGITGTLGAGKGTIVDYLVQEKRFVHFSVRGFITEEIIRQGLPVNRDSMVAVANKLRADNSPSYIIDQLYDQALLTGKNCIIESIRTPGEVESLRSKGNFLLFAVDADPMLRFDRIVMRNSETDRISFATFVENEEREMQSHDPNKQNIGKCIDKADYIFYNNSTVRDLYQKLEAELSRLKI